MGRENVIGQVFGRLTVLDNAPDYYLKSGKYKRMVKVRCSCKLKTIKVVRLECVKTGSIRSCGCLKLEKLVERSTTHNLVKSKEYRLWQDIKKRTTNVKCKHYHNYGGRGIIVYELWLNDFLAFHNWLKENIGLHPGKPYSLDRIDNNGNYEPGNLRWATPSQQAINQRIRKTNTSGVKGVFYDKKDKVFKTTINIKGVVKRFKGFKTLEEAVVARKEAEMLRDSLEPNAALMWLDFYTIM